MTYMLSVVREGKPKSTQARNGISQYTQGPHFLSQKLGYGSDKYGGNFERSQIMFLELSLFSKAQIT